MVHCSIVVIFIYVHISSWYIYLYIYVYIILSTLITSVDPCMCEMNGDEGVGKSRKQPSLTVSARKDA